jgi:hypothetical protein
MILAGSEGETTRTLVTSRALPPFFTPLPIRPPRQRLSRKLRHSDLTVGNIAKSALFENKSICPFAHLSPITSEIQSTKDKTMKDHSSSSPCHVVKEVEGTPMGQVAIPGTPEGSDPERRGLT